MEDIICKSKNIKYNNFSKKINSNKYTQKYNKDKKINYVSSDIVELLIYIYDINFQVLSNNEKKLELYNYKCSIVDNIHNLDIYDKSFKKEIIKNGLLNKNQLSSLYYLSNHYKENIIIIFDKFYYQCNYLNDNNLYILYNGQEWMKIEEVSIDNYQKMPQNILFDILNNDLNSDRIYKLRAISYYNLNSLKILEKMYKLEHKKKKNDIYNSILSRIKI